MNTDEENRQSSGDCSIDGRSCGYRSSDSGAVSRSRQLSSTNGTNGGFRTVSPSNGLAKELQDLVIERNKIVGSNGELRSRRQVRRTQKYQHKVRLNVRTYPKKYDNEGIHMNSGLDFCDCLDTRCPGCHDECPDCGSNKCGIQCRCNRTWCHSDVQEFQVDGPKRIIRTKPV